MDACFCVSHSTARNKRNTFRGLLIVLPRQQTINPAFFNLEKRAGVSILDTRSPNRTMRLNFSRTGINVVSVKNLWVYRRVLMADMCFSAGATVVPPGLMTQPLMSQQASGCRFPVSRVWLCVCLNTHTPTHAESGILTRWRTVTSSERHRTSTKPTWRRCK